MSLEDATKFIYQLHHFKFRRLDVQWRKISNSNLYYNYYGSTHIQSFTESWLFFGSNNNQLFTFSLSREN